MAVDLLRAIFARNAHIDFAPAALDIAYNGNCMGILCPRCPLLCTRYGIIHSDLTKQSLASLWLSLREAGEI